MLKRIEMKRDRGYDYLDVYTTDYTEARGLLLENKLYIDFPGARVGARTVVKLRRSQRVAGLQAIQKDEKTARLVVTLKKAVDYDIVNVFGQDKSVIEIGDRLDKIGGYQLAWEEKEVKKRAQPLKPVRLAAVRSAGPATLRGRTVVLDPGHGGDDPGAIAINGVPEKELTLQTAQAAAKLLREEGATVYLTRDEDRRSNLKDVAAFANRVGADIFISIHYNSTYSADISGTETYYYNPDSRVFAETMHEAIVRGIKRKDRGLHRMAFYVVKNTEMPAVLIEPVYLTNGEESGLARSDGFREELAGDIAKGVKEYFRSKRG